MPGLGDAIVCQTPPVFYAGCNACTPSVKDHQLQMDRKQHEVRELAAENAKLNQDYTVLNKRLKC
eukprot:scaffold214178_cov13-Tisochrysis_lutea.AAC.1